MNLKRRITVAIAKRADKYLRGVDWGDLYPTEDECPYCGATAYATDPEFPEADSALRCKACGASGFGGPVGERDPE